MNVEHLQVENGHFTRIVNPLIEELVKIPFKGCELAIALHIIRQTYGYQKKQDEISISQFEKALLRGRPTIVKALKNLQLVKVVKLVKTGTMNGQGSVWLINKYTNTWGVVKTGSLVKGKSEPSKYGYTKGGIDGLTHKRKKEITKETSDEAKASGVEKLLNFTVEDVKMVDLLVSLIQTNNPAWEMKGSHDKWAGDVNKLFRIDGRTYEQIEYMIRWTQRDTFWSKNILSASKLREKFNNLIPRLKVTEGNGINKRGVVW